MRSVILKHAIPLIQTHGFTRKTLSLAALSLPNPHPEPLSDTAVSVLFGAGDEARKTLIYAWSDEGINWMGRRDGSDANGDAQEIKGSVSIRDALRDRLEWNEPVLERLPEAFALLSVPQTPVPVPVLDPRPAVSHVAKIADKACFLAGDPSIGTSWYTQRAAVALVYTAAELHQLTSPTTALEFLDTLLQTYGRAQGVVSDVEDYAGYVLRSWAGILKSKGHF